MKSLFNKLRFTADILAADHSTTVLAQVAAGFEELSGRALELAQLHSSECSVRFTVRWDVTITSNCYVQFEGGLYPIDYIRDPGNVDQQDGLTRGILMEIYAHRIQDGTSNGDIPAGVLFAQQLDGGKVHITLRAILSTATLTDALLNEAFYLTDTHQIAIWNGTQLVVTGGTPLVLKVNNTNNAIQTTLNLRDDGYVTLTDNGDGSVSIASTTLRALITAEAAARATADSLSELLSHKDQPNGYAGLTQYGQLNGNQFGNLDLSGYALKTRNILTTAPLTGGSDLSFDRTLAIDAFTGDSGAGGAKGAVPAPAAGDSAAKKVLKAGGTWGAIVESDVTNLTTDLSAKAPLASPALTGTPTAPTAASGTDTTQVATTAFVEDAIDTLVAADIPNIAESQVTNLVSDLALKAPLASPALTGTPTVPTAAVDTNTTQAASTAFVLAQASAATPLIDGSAAVGTSTRFARADHVHPTDTTREATANKDVANGHAGLDANGKLKNAEFPPLTAADQGYLFSNGNLNASVNPAGTTVLVSNANETWVVQFVLDCALTLGKVTYKSGSVVAASSFASFGVYDASGTLKAQGTFDTSANASTTRTATFTRVTLPPGVYYFAWTTNNATINTTYTFLLNNTTVIDLLNFAATAKRVGKGTASSGGVLNGSMGAVTAAAVPNQSMPAVIFEYN